MDPEAAMRRIAWDATHPPVYHAGISEKRLRSLRIAIGDLESADPRVFDHPPAGDPDVRRLIRYLAAIVPDSIPAARLPYVVADIINNPDLSAEQVRDILDGSRTGQHGLQVPVSKLREAARRLRMGQSQRDVAADLGISRRQITPLANFMGVTEARVHYLRDQAMDALEEGVPVETFAAAHGISETVARTLLDDVEEALA